MKRPPINILVQIDEHRLSELIYYWNYYNKPCNLLFMKPKTEGLAAIRLTVDSDQAADFLRRVMDKTGCKIYELDNNNKVKK